jgi:hypothetical protein
MIIPLEVKYSGAKIVPRSDLRVRTASRITTSKGEKNCLLPDAIEGQMAEVKGMGRRT